MKWLTKNGKNIKDASCFKELDVLSVWLKAFLELKSLSWRTKSSYIAIFNINELRKRFFTQLFSSFVPFKTLGLNHK
jgi:hypothetical protein